jgi:hypothetical protein
MTPSEALEGNRDLAPSPGTRNRAGVALAAALTLLAGSRLAEREAWAQPPVPAPDFTVSETKTEGPGKGEWTVKTEVKNNTTAKGTIVFWSWPAGPSKAKIGKNEWEPAGTQPKSADPNDPDHKQPKNSAPGVNPGVEVDAGKTVTLTKVRTADPNTSYVRVFQKNADGTWTQKNVVAHNVHLAAFLVPKTNPVAEYVTIPVRIPYPTDLPALTGNQPADFFIRNVTLPEGWQTAYLGPALEERFRLQPTQREFTGILVAKPMKAMAEGEQAVAQITWGVEHDGKVLEYEFTIRALLVSDSLPPTVSLTTQRRPEGTWVTVTVQDPGGVHHGVHLDVARQGSHGRSAQTLFLPQTRALVSSPSPEIGATAAVYEALIPAPCDATETLTLQASASDQFGNSARSATQTALAGVAMASGVGGTKK